MCNIFKDPNGDLSGLVGKWGAKNVENAAIFIMGQYTPDQRELRISIPATKQRVERVLLAIHEEYM